MWIALHKQARTTPSVRAETAASQEPLSKLARRYHVTVATLRKWPSRTDCRDRLPTVHRPQTTETIVVHLRKPPPLSLDDLLAVTCRFFCPAVSRSGLDRYLRRHGVGYLHMRKPVAEKAAHAAFKSYLPGYFHILNPFIDNQTIDRDVILSGNSQQN
jgi:hypothetical protein